MIKINVLSPEDRAANAAFAALNDAIAAFEEERRFKSFSERHPELGKMINCQVCSSRHREHERKCEQRFTYTVDGFEYFVDDENGNKVPDYRTAIRPGERPTVKQQIGRAAFAKKRFHPHPSKIKLQFIERTRLVFARLGFDVDSDKATFEKNLQRARVVAAREIRREREISDREYRRQADQSRRINAGLL